MFRPLVPHCKLNQQSSSGGLEVKAALQHRGLCGGSFSWQINNHQTLKLLKELLWHLAARSLGLLPRHLEPVERLIHLHHLLMKSAHAHYAWVQVCGCKHNKTIWVNAGIWYKDNEQRMWNRYTMYIYVWRYMHLWKPRCRVSWVRMRFSVSRL